MDQNDILLSVNEYGRGRGVYIAGLPYSAQNARLLQRAIYYAAHQESELMTYYVDSCEVECTYFPEVKKLAVYNNSFEVQEAQIYVRGEVKHRVTLNEMDLIWLDVE